MPSGGAATTRERREQSLIKRIIMVNQKFMTLYVFPKISFILKK